MKTHGEYFYCSPWRKGHFMELKTIGLTKKFASKTAVDDLNITLTNGVYGLLGANGAGKTTLMRLLCNIQNPTSGKILLNGKNIVGFHIRYILLQTNPASGRFPVDERYHTTPRRPVLEEALQNR